jgi:hypothetical protein
MAIYVVMEPPAASEAEAVDRAAMVRDGFAFLAFLLPPLWLLWHRLWIEAAFVIAASVALTALGETAGFGFIGAALSLLVSLFVGLEGTALRVNALRRRGWREWGVVEAGNAAEAEIRYLAGDGESGEDEAAAMPPRAPPVSSRLASSTPALGLLGYPGRH